MSAFFSKRGKVEPSGLLLKIVGQGDPTYSFVVVGVEGTKYVGPEELVLPKDTQIKCTVSNSYPVLECGVYLNGKKVAENPQIGGMQSSFFFGLRTDTTINLVYGQVGPGYLRGKIEITEE